MSKKQEDDLVKYSNTKKGKKLAENLALALFESAVSNGSIDVEGKSEEELISEFLKLLTTFTQSSDKDVLWIVDHRTDVLQQARTYAKSKDYNLACMLYATWFEHWLNNVIVTTGRKRGLEGEEVFHIIRDTPFRGKLTWIFPLLGLRKLSITHRNAIFKITDIRNSFVHYKWRGKDDASNEREKKELIDCLANIEKTIKYLRRYENNFIFYGKKKTLRKIVSLPNQ